MKNIALLFPGQGSQYPGMGKELYDNYPKAREILDSINRIAGFDLLKVIFEGPEETLKQTQYTQPAIFAVTMAAFKVFEEKFVLDKASVLGAGHSLGEYSALCAGGVFSFADGLKLVKKRGEFIQKASEDNPGAMAAIIGLDNSVVDGICKKASEKGVCEPVNFNSPGQIVVAGSVDAVKLAVELAQASGATKALMLNVSGPFHSSLMKPASLMMQEELKNYRLQDPGFKIFSNCDAKPAQAGAEIAQKLVRQISSPVLWEGTIRNMIASGAEVFIEIGPQRVLSGLLRRIDKTKKTLNIEDMKSLNKTIEEIGK